MRFHKSIRWRLLLLYGSVFALMLAGFGFTAWRLERASRLRQVDEELQRHLAIVTRALREYHPEAEDRDRPAGLNLRFSPEDGALFRQADGRGSYYVVWLRSGAPLASSPQAPRNVPRPEHFEVSVRQRGALREAFSFTPPVDCLLVGRRIDDDLDALNHLAWLLAGAGTIVLVLALGAGWWLTSHALRPIRDISSAAARIANGDLSQRINTSQTESELGELAAMLNATFSRLDAAFEQQARFTSDAAHELRTPLTVLLTRTQAALARERSQEEYREALQSNQAAAQRMRGLTESLLELARLDAGQEPLRRVPCDLAAIAADCTELMEPLAEARRITLLTALSSAPCVADPDRLSQVVTNLLKNAIDHNREGGEVRVRTTSHDGNARLEVADTGPGIAPEHLPHVFERFYRADPSRAKGTGGTGLGLAISKAIIDAHGGTITAGPREGGGSVFALTLPAPEA